MMVFHSTNDTANNNGRSSSPIMNPNFSRRECIRAIRWFTGMVCGMFLNIGPETRADPQPLHPAIRVRHVLNTASGSNPIRIVSDPRDNNLYYLKASGSIYRIALHPGSGTSTETRVYGSEHHTITSAAGMAIGPDGTMYVVGNTPTNNGNSTFATIMKGVPATQGVATWSVLARSQPYPRSLTAFDHVFNGILASPDGNFIYVNSGSRTDHGEIQSVNGLFPNARDVALTAKIFRLPSNASNLVLTNDIAVLRSAGFVYAEGVRNTYDMAFAPNGDLFGTENGPDRDMSEELNWLREGHHYGFPWRIGGADNPQQFPGYDPAADRLLDPRFVAVQGGYYHNDPTFPPPPANLAEPVINVGPDADRYRDPADGQVKDASSESRTLGTFTAHRSPLGLVFDVEGVLVDEFRYHGFVSSWTPGDPNGTNVAGPFNDASQDLLDLELTKLGGTNYQARVRRIVGGFANPIDAAIIENRIYVVEYGGSRGIWEVTVPRRMTIEGELASGGEFRLTIAGESGSSIVIQTSTNLSTWLDLTNLLNSTGTVEFNDSTPGNFGRRFYRAASP
jgi:hypothetical protein